MDSPGKQALNRHDIELCIWVAKGICIKYPLNSFVMVQ